MAFVRDIVKLAPDEIDAYRASPAWASGVDLIWTMHAPAVAASKAPRTAT